MAENNQDEIDLGYLFRKISGFFKSLIRLLFMVIAFFIKYIIIILVLIIVGVALGYFIDKNKIDVYNNELIVIPNFESTQYMYDKVNALSAKIKDKDTVFLKNTIGPNYKQLKKIEAKPILDVYTFLTGSPTRVELFKALTIKQDIPEYLNDPQNFQYYKYHHLDIKVKGKEHSNEIIKSIEAYLNESSHYMEYMKVGRTNTQFRIETSENTISQIDSVLKATAQLKDNKGTLPSVLVSDNSQLNDLIGSKDRLTYSLLKLNMQKIDEQSIIKVASVNYNISQPSLFSFSNKIKYPLLLVLLFSGFFFVKRLYGKMKDIAETHAK